MFMGNVQQPSLN